MRLARSRRRRGRRPPGARPPCGRAHRRARRAGRAHPQGRPPDRPGVEARLERDEDPAAAAFTGGLRPTAAPSPAGRRAACVSTVTMPGRDAFAPALGRSASQTLPLSDANASCAAFSSSTLRLTFVEPDPVDAFSPDGHDGHVGHDQPQHRPRLSAVDGPSRPVERDHVEAGVDVDPVAGLDLPDQAVRGVERDRDDALAVGELGGERVACRARSRPRSAARPRRSRGSRPCPWRLAGSLIAPSRSWLSRIVVAV